MRHTPLTSGIHHERLLNRTPQTYEIMTPESVGVAKTSSGVGKQRGAATLPARKALEEFGYPRRQKPHGGRI